MRIGRSICRSFDAVIWLGGEGFTKDNFAAAKHFIDASAIENKPVRPTLLPGANPGRRRFGTAFKLSTPVSIPVVYKAQRTLLTSLAKSIGLGLCADRSGHGLAAQSRTCAVWLAHPSNFGNGLVAGLVAMIPNVFPVLLVFGVHVPHGNRYRYRNHDDRIGGDGCRGR